MAHNHNLAPVPEGAPSIEAAESAALTKLLARSAMGLFSLETELNALDRLLRQQNEVIEDNRRRIRELEAEREARGTEVKAPDDPRGIDGI